MLRLLARDKLLWAAGALIALLIAGAVLLKPSAPDIGSDVPLAGRQAQAEPGQDPALAAVVNGTFPALDADLTLGKAFAAYRWFSGEPKWLARGAAGSRLVGVTAVLEVPAAAARLGVGSSAAAVLYVAEFEVSPDGASFRPVLSALEVRDASNRLLTRFPDPEFVLVRRVMRGLEPALDLPGQHRKAP
ncbi:hypothetical protein [Fundidesulfovibrio agrisoli]|uniref:hypothetical protein n=1 Tax=Fundidesulfovibrio agrisoli TaxID=2922717 RepID=UPI001FAC46FD|nr:hypothetical protein [Fundidesulfovibrio agrisoli]